MSTKQNLIRKALWLEYFLVAYNVLEAFFSIAIGFWTTSIALVSFGFDSVIEVTAGLVLIWRLSHKGDSAGESKKEKRALFLISLTFFALAGYILFESIKMLWLQQKSEYTPWGMLIALLSALIMPALGFMKLSIGDKIGSKALKADAKETLFCAYLSIILLLGLGLNALWGWWWADPVAALLMLGFIIKEGIEALEESREKN